VGILIMTIRNVIAIAAFAVTVASCAVEPQLTSTLDDKGRTWVSADAVVTLARAAPRFSSAARDYLYLAPVEVNTTGVRRDYLWVGLSSTVDRRWLSAEPPTAASVVLALDGLRVVLPLSPWDTALAPSLHSTAAPVYQAQRAAISLDQLERLARAESVHVQVVSGDGSTDTYELWNGAWADWQPFLAAAGKR